MKETQSLAGYKAEEIQNEEDTDYIVNKGDKYLQGVFTKFLIVDNEEENNNLRKGGLGSTDKESE